MRELNYTNQDYTCLPARLSESVLDMTGREITERIKLKIIVIPFMLIMTLCEGLQFALRHV